MNLKIGDKVRLKTRKVIEKRTRVYDYEPFGEIVTISEVFHNKYFNIEGNELVYKPWMFEEIKEKELKQLELF